MGTPTTLTNRKFEWLNIWIILFVQFVYSIHKFADATSFTSDFCFLSLVQYD